MSTIKNKPVTVSKIKNSKTGIEDFKFINKEGTHCNVYVESIQDTFNVNLENGNTFMSKVKRGAFISGNVEDMSNFKEGQVLPGKIVKVSSYKPFYDGQDPVINPKTKQTVLNEGKEYFIKFVYDPSGKLEDLWLKDLQDIENEEVIDETSQSF